MSDAEKILMVLGLTDFVSVTLVEYYLEEWATVFPDNECLVMHNTVVSIYEYLIREAATTSSGGGSRREKQGEREIEVDDYDLATSWQDALDSYLDNPSSAFPSCKEALTPQEDSLLGRVIVGGVSKERIKSIEKDRNIVTGGASYLRRGYPPLPPRHPQPEEENDESSSDE